MALAQLVGGAGRVFAFEPSLTTVGYLNRTRGLNGLDQIIVVPLGLGKPGGIRMLSVPMERGMANHASETKVFDTIYVVGLDELRDSLSIPRIDGVKIDVQGMELEALTGMAHTLKVESPKLVIEFHSGVPRGPIVDCLRMAGYQLPAKPIGRALAGRRGAYLNDQSYAFESQQRT
jgi:FkbM family methyltransferase